MQRAGVDRRSVLRATSIAAIGSVASSGVVAAQQSKEIGFVESKLLYEVAGNRDVDRMTI
jgi:hypothetical protein